MLAITIVHMATGSALAVPGAVPQIDSLSTQSIDRSGRLLIFGADFGATQGKSRVLIDGRVAIATTWTDTEIHAYVPEAASIASVPVTVVTAAGSSTTTPINVTMRGPDSAMGQSGDHVRWRFQMDSDFAGRFITVAPDGTVYASDLSRLYALSPNGGLLWVAQVAGDRRPISLGADGTIYTAGYLVKALNPDGTLKWHFPNPNPGGELTAGPNVGPDGNIYAVHNTWFGGIGTFSLDPDGNLRWADPLHSGTLPGALSNAEIVFGPDRAFVGFALSSPGAYVTKAVDFDGDELWYSGTDGLDLNAWFRPKLDPSGRVISSKWSLSIQAITSDGNVDWVSLNPHGNSMVMPGINPSSGVIYTSSWGPSLWAINPDGSTRWTTFDSTFNLVRSLNVAPDGSMILTAGEIGLGGPGWLKAYDTVDGTLLWQIDLPPEAGGEQFVWSVQPTFTPDSQTAYVTTEILGSPGFSFVYAIRTGDQVVPIPGDLDGDGIVGIVDFLALLAAWGPCPAPPSECPADVDGNGAVDILDFLELLSNWT
ncbi:MAG: PQQ-binding-like beta-propeller repeat protein [Phycisphaerales bacterium]